MVDMPPVYSYVRDTIRSSVDPHRITCMLHPNAAPLPPLESVFIRHHPGLTQERIIKGQAKFSRFTRKNGGHFELINISASRIPYQCA